MDRDQGHRNVGPDLQSILFDIQHHFLLKTGCISLDDLNSWDIEVLSFLQIVPEFSEGIVYIYFDICMPVLAVTSK